MIDKTIREIHMTLSYEEIIMLERFMTGKEPSNWAKNKLKGQIEGYAWGKIDAMKSAILSTLSIRFSPALAAKALPVVRPMQDYEALKQLHRQLLRADDDKSVLLVLDLSDR